MKRVWIMTFLAGILLLSGCSKQTPMKEGTASTAAEATAAETTAKVKETEETTIEPLNLPTQESETPALPRIGSNRILLATDLHYLAQELTDGGDAFHHMVEHGDGKVVTYVCEIVDAFLAEVVKEKPDILVLSGDLSLEGEKLSHRELAAKLEAVEQAGITVVVIPGNHDINNVGASIYRGNERYPAEKTSPEEFQEIYQDFGYVEALSCDPNSLSYLYPLDEKNYLLMLDSCQYDDGAVRVGGVIRTETYEWMEPLLEDAWCEGINVIPVAHHNLLEESQVYLENCTIEHAEDLEEKLSNWGNFLFLSGHLHVQHFKSSPDYEMDEIVTASLSTAPCLYGVLDYRDDGSFEYHTQRVRVAAWAAEHAVNDEKLLNFDTYSTELLKKVFYNQAYDGLKNHEISPADKARMSDLYAELHAYSVEGRAIEIKEKILSDPSYRMWQERDGVSINYLYMEEILRDAIQDYNSFRK
ncbi:MAG: metallophosphoesterase [Hungatella sp.]